MNTARRHTIVRLIPLFWLAYLCFPVLHLLSVPRSPAVYAAFTVGLAVLLWVYVRTYAVFRPISQLSPRWSYLGWAWCLLLFAAGYPVLGNHGITFLNYGGGLAGFQGNARHTFWLTSVNLTLMLLPAVFGRYHHEDLTWLLPNFVICAAGAYGNHSIYRQIMAETRLIEVQAEKEKLAQIAERERIARDLHDLLGHTLSVIVLKSELAAKLTERDPARAAQEIREVERISRDALSEVRSAVRGYRGSGLNAELARSKVALDAAGVALEYDGQPLELPPPVEATMEMLLREAITNVVRHARARKVRVRVGQTAGYFELEVHDDGTGGNAPDGTGLTGMRERVRALGGTFKRDGRAGTRLLARFPAVSSAGTPVMTWREVQA